MDLVCLGYNSWSGMWKRNQTMVAALARQPWVRQALFLNPDLWLGALLRDPRQHLTGVARAAWRGVRPFRAAPKTDVFTRCRLPFAGRLPALAALEQRMAQAVIDRRVAEPYILLVNRLEDPESPIVARLFERAALRVFDWSDDFEQFEACEVRRVRARRAQEFFLAESDLVLAVNDQLAQRARAYGRPVLVVRNATHYDVLSRAAAPDVRIARPLRRIPRPIIGYMGYLSRTRLDVGLLEAVAARRPSWSLAFLGPSCEPRPLGDRLPRAPNVHRLPPVPYERLPQYLAGFDVCMLPNLVNAWTDGNDPLKLYDYLATGKPIVATRTAGTERLRDVIRIAEGPEAFADAVSAALAEDADARTRRLDVARAHSWETRVREVGAALRSLVGIEDAQATPSS